MLKRTLTLILLCLCMNSCINTPTGTVLLDTDGDGRPDVLAIDADGDGNADLDQFGETLLVPGSEGYKLTETVDATVPNILMIIGSTLGVPVLFGIGAAWKGAKFGRIFQNTVMSVQAARKRLSDKGMGEALNVVNEALTEQLPATIEAVKKAKEALGLSSVTRESRKTATEEK